MGRDNDNYMNGTVDDVSCLFVLTLFVFVSNSLIIVLGFLGDRKNRAVTFSPGIIINKRSRSNS